MTRAAGGPAEPQPRLPHGVVRGRCSHTVSPAPGQFMTEPAITPSRASREGKQDLAGDAGGWTRNRDSGHLIMPEALNRPLQ